MPIEHSSLTGKQVADTAWLLLLHVHAQLPVSLNRSCPLLSIAFVPYTLGRNSNHSCDYLSLLSWVELSTLDLAILNYFCTLLANITSSCPLILATWVSVFHLQQLESVRALLARLPT